MEIGLDMIPLDFSGNIYDDVTNGVLSHLSEAENNWRSITLKK